MRELPVGKDDFALVADGLSKAADAAVELLREKVAEVMREHGEDPEDPYLFACRVRQTSYSVDSATARAWREVGGP